MLKTTVNAIAKPSTKRGLGTVTELDLGIRGDDRPTTAATISTRFTASTWVSRSRRRITLIIGPGAARLENRGQGRPPRAI